MKQVLWAGLGQGLAVAATMVPIVAQQHAALSASIFCASVSTLFLMPVLAALPLRLPGISDMAEVRGYMAVLLRILGCCLGLLGILGVLAACQAASGRSLFWVTPAWAIEQVAFGACLLLVGQGFYSVVSAWFVRRADVRRVGGLRFNYGAGAFVGAMVAILFGDGFYQVIIPSTVSLLAAAFVTVVVAHPHPKRLLRVVWRSRSCSYADAWRSGWRLCLASTANGFTAQAGGLVLPMLGPIAEAWAIMLRIGGGFTTIGQAVIAPFVDTEVGAASRAKRPDLFRKALLRGLRMGVALAVLGVATCLLALRLLESNLPSDSQLLLGLAISFLLFGQISLGPISRSLAVANSQRKQVAWDVMRFLVVGAMVAIVPAPATIVALGCNALAFAGAFVWMAWHASAEIGPGLDALDDGGRGGVWG